jgi:acetyl-CoA carboxylase biotin carboxylase subunit
LAKVLVRGRDREEALVRSRRALQMMQVEGIKTSIPLQLAIIDDPEFRAGAIDTHFMERFLKAAERQAV